MSLDRPALKARVRQMMGIVRPHPCWIAIASLVVSHVLVYLASDVTGQLALQQQLLTAQTEQQIQMVMENYLYHLRPWGLLLGLALMIMNHIWSCGFTIYCLRATRGHQVNLACLMDGFSLFFRLLWLHILMGIFVYLWSLLLIIPGIIASYRYRQAIYILLEHPEMRPMECIRQSSALMRGHKWELFVLDLSLIGWYVLSLIPLVTIWVLPYTEFIRAEYYNQLTGWPPATEDGKPGADPFGY